VIEAASGQQCQAADGHCITCGDEGVPMRVVATDGMTATCRDDESHIHEVESDLVGPIGVGDRVLVHAGVAIA
jgi:hydrogenase expression/formation protein HypC